MRTIGKLLERVQVQWKTLGEVGEVRMCKRILKEQTSDFGEIPFYKIGTFGKAPNAYISRELFEDFKSKYNYPRIGEVLISASGTIGRTVIFDGKDAYFQDSNIVWVENEEKDVLNKYLFYLYQIVKWEIAEGGTIQRLYNDNLKKTKIPIPSLPVQSEIVRILDTFTEHTAELTAELTARKKQYDFYKQFCFDNFINCETKHITDIAIVKARVGWQRLSKAEYLSSGEYYLITGTDFTTGRKIDFKNCVFVTKERYDMDTNIQVYKDDILITKDGTLGKVAFIEEEPNKLATLNSGVFRIKIIDKNVLPRYVYHFFTSNYFTNFVESVKTGSTIPHLTQQGLVTLDIPIPTLEEQERIVSILDKFDTLTTSISEGLPKEIELRKKQYEYYRDLLLTFPKSETA